MKTPQQLYEDWERAHWACRTASWAPTASSALTPRLKRSALRSDRPTLATEGEPMAEEVAIAGTGSTAKLRNPLGVVGLSIITIGIYYVFWWYFINREMRDFGRARGTDLGQNPGNSVLALTLGALVIVPAIVTLWRTCDRIQRPRRSRASTGRRAARSSSCSC